LCGLEEVRSYVGTEAYRECVIDVKKVNLESFPVQAVPDGNELSNSPEPPSLKAIFDDIEKLLPKL
jgi:hypothetical protein